MTGGWQALADQLGAQLRMLVNGSARFSFPNAAEEVNAAMKADGVGFGLSLGKEWYASDWRIWGAKPELYD